jgi:hypothetical protein
MALAIDLDYESQFATVEINNVFADRLLPHKLIAPQLTRL